MNTKATYEHPPTTIDGVAVTYRPLEEYPKYLFGDDGSIWSRAYNRGSNNGWQRINGCVNPKRGGYVMVAIRRRDGSYKTSPAHKFILEAFVGPCPPGMVACHDPDPDRTNNRPSNLRWDTHKANADDARKFGSFKAKLSDADVHEIRRLHRDGWSFRRIAGRFNVACTTARTACHGITYWHVPMQEPPCLASAAS